MTATATDIQVILYCDGCCEPRNPGGYACWGIVALHPDERERQTGIGFVGVGDGMTNNVAEYHALIRALQWCARVGLTSGVVIRTDSQLVVRQVNGEWACNARNLVGLRDAARALRHIVDCTLEWVPRGQNCRADGLSREAYALARRGMLRQRGDING
jgi:ribonuclease HI